ncbi:MAG TPA: hypothetical protein VGM98_13785 [Schlesneria sp.]|jgi:hypothetical protein
MDVIAKKVREAGTGTVVRQFVPTRIERQVLAHVFALVCGGRSCESAADFPCVGASVRQLPDDEQCAEVIETGRRAA